MPPEDLKVSQIGSSQLPPSIQGTSLSSSKKTLSNYLCLLFPEIVYWGHKAPTQSKRKRTGKKKLKGHGPEHVYNTLGYIYRRHNNT